MVILGVLINETCHKTGRVSTRDLTVSSFRRDDVPAYADKPKFNKLLSNFKACDPNGCDVID